ncbi:amidohydrolase [Bacillus alkalicellulosilyticus]|uniref:amidohydrolase n=1 Tax=Alkalihalobacterium alkalicellulosilyticum TaxID=1912214 RepID=UPI000997D704|nr:amidohydrolase [Bacillus alkalicellulosilyticus]
MGTLWYNGTFFTMNGESETVEAVYVEKGYIVAIGTKVELEHIHSNQINKRIDLHKKYIYPGFVDSHLHIIGHGEKIIRLDLSNVTSAEEMKQLLLNKVSSTKKGEWVIGEGWNENNFPDRKIFHRQELDDISSEHPIMLTRVCRHAILANSKALEIAKIRKSQVDPQGGIIVKDNEGEPTGYLLDEAQEIVKECVPEVSEAYLHKALQVAVDDMLSLGLVGGHTEDLAYYGGFERTFTTFQKVIDGTTRKFRAHLLVHHDVVDTMQQNYNQGEITPFLEFGGMKIFADGALGGRTALLSKPYNDAPETSGVAIHTSEELESLVKKARDYDMSVAIHVIGDLALEMAIETIKKHPVKQGLRDRLIHLQVTRKELLVELQKLSVVLDIQPMFVSSDFPWVQERLGEERLPYSFAWKTLMEHGLHCAGGSDAPIEPVNPLQGIHAAITRRKPEESHEGYGKNEKLSAFEAVSLFTTGSAYAIGKEETRGKIFPGYTADFTVLDQNLFEIEPDQILKTKVLKTVVDNTIMYERGN